MAESSTRPELQCIESGSARPVTTESSATTVPPPSSVQSWEAIPVCELNPGSIDHSTSPVLLKTAETLHVKENAQCKAGSSMLEQGVHVPAKKQDDSTTDQRLLCGSAQPKQPPLTQPRKRKSGPLSPETTKRPRLGPTQTNIKKPRKNKPQRKQGGNGKLRTTTSGLGVVVPLTLDGETPKETPAPMQAECIFQEQGTTSVRNAKDGSFERTGATFPEALRNKSKQQNCMYAKVSQGAEKSGDKKIAKKGAAGRKQASKAQTRIGAPAPEQHQPPVAVLGQGQKKTTAPAVSSKRDAVGTGPGRENTVTVKKSKKTTKSKSSGKRSKDSDRSAGTPTLEEKYDDLSRKYMTLVKELVQSSGNSTAEAIHEQLEEDGEDPKQTLIVDSKLYDMIHLSTMAGMLGSSKIREEPGEYLRESRSEEFKNPCERIILDGFKFVEELMLMGEPEKDCGSSVHGVFRKLHLRLLIELWEKNHDKEGGRLVVQTIMKIICDQVKEWYMKIIWGKMGIRWCAFFSEELVEVLYKKVKAMNEGLASELVTMGRSTLQEISRLYQEAEKAGSKASLEMFFNSCEVSICVARSVPEAALSLEEEDAFAIGRHNGLFSYCVVRLQAERAAEDEESR